MKRSWGSDIRLLWDRLSFFSDLRLSKALRSMVVIWACINYSLRRLVRFWKEFGRIRFSRLFDSFSFFRRIRVVRLGMFLRLYMFRLR